MILRPYQAEAIEAITAGLADGGRGQLHAACGSGKTLIGVQVGARLLPHDGLIVVLAPSLSLVAQTLHAWRGLSRLDAALAVCSDDTVTDAPVHLDEIEAEATTDPERVIAWLAQARGRRLVVGTYRSAHCLAQALREADQEADLVVFDEAHHLAGRPDLVTRKVVEESYLPARRRLFMTATPRIDDVRVETSGGLSMDDTAAFGPVLYSYPWAQAISDGYLDDYRIVVMGVTEQQVYDLLRDEGTEFVDRIGAPDLRMLAAQAVIAKAARQYGLRRILAFCPRLAAAGEFAATFPATVTRLPVADRPAGDLHAARISGEMTSRQRETVLDQLRHPPGHWAVVANVRCLSEGVDVPAVDAVAFTHPKRSQVDIVQAVGRALRRSPDGTGTATIIVPIVIPDSAEEVGDLDPGEFRTLWQVVRALRAHDEALGIELDMQRSYGAVHNPQLPSRITVELPPGTSDRVLTQLKALTVRQATSSWWEGYGHARAYHAEHGHLDVPSGHITDDGFRLGQWITNARQHYRKGWLRRERIEALDKIGMVWNTRGLPWQRFVDEMKRFRDQHGHVLVPQSYVTPTGYRLGSKVNRARSLAHRVPEHVRKILDDLGMVWDTRDLRWQQLYNACYVYSQEHGHLDVPVGYRTPDGYPLGRRLKYYRKLWRTGRLDPAEQASLEELGMRFTDITDEPWRRFLAACDRYIATHGSLANVRKDYVDPTGYRLGSTISYYRNLHNGTKGDRRLDPDRKAELDRRGMVWRLAPTRDITPTEGDSLRRLHGPERAREIIRLLDEGVSQSSVADALGVHRSYLNTKIKTFRETGHWPERRRDIGRAGQVAASSSPE